MDERRRNAWETDRSNSKALKRVANQSASSGNITKFSDKARRNKGPQAFCCRTFMISHSQTRSACVLVLALRNGAVMGCTNCNLSHVSLVRRAEPPRRGSRERARYLSSPSACSALVGRAATNVVRRRRTSAARCSARLRVGRNESRERRRPALVHPISAISRSRRSAVAGRHVQRLLSGFAPVRDVTAATTTDRQRWLPSSAQFWGNEELAFREARPHSLER